MDKIEEKLFHSCIPYINSGNRMSSRTILIRVLKNGYLYTREDLKKQGINIYDDKRYLQKDNEICYALHRNNPYVSVTSRDICFDLYTENYYSFVISPKMVESRKIDLKDELDIRITGSVDLKRYLEAISIPNPVISDLEYIKRSSNVANLSTIIKFRKSYIEDIDKLISDYDRKKYDIEYMLDDIGYNIPVVEPNTGLEDLNDLYKEAKEYRKIMSR